MLLFCCFSFNCEMKKSATRENITFSPDTGLQEIRIPHLGMPKAGLLSASDFMRLSAVSPRSPEIYGSRVDTSGPYSRRYTSKYLFQQIISIILKIPHLSNLLDLNYN